MPTRVHPQAGHLVQFYEKDEELIGAVAHYFAHGVEAGGSGIMIATPAHIAACVDAAGVADGSILTLDAAETLGKFMVGGAPDPLAFDATVGNLVRAAASKGAPLRAYGEMVTLLWEEGNVTGALELDALWYDLLSSVGFSLYCAYSTAILSDDQAEPVTSVRQLHSDIVESFGPPSAGAGIRLLFPAEKDSPRHARRVVLETLRRWGRNDLSDDAALIVTELASNAILHGRGRFRLTISSRGEAVRIEIEDTSTALPVRGAAAAQDSNGRGLLLVDSLSERWGVEPTASGKIVWSEISGVVR